MTRYTIFDDNYRNNLLPLCFTKPVSELRIGILTVREKWEKRLGCKINSWKTQNYLTEKFPEKQQDEAILLNGHVCPSQTIADMVLALKINQGIKYGERIIAVHVSKPYADISINHMTDIVWSEIEANTTILTNNWDLFNHNPNEITSDFELITRNRESEAIPADCQIKNSMSIFIEKGAKISFASLNAATGPIYIGSDAEIMEGSLIRGPFVLGEHATVNMGAKIYGPVSVGPHSKVGGELNNVNIQGY